MAMMLFKGINVPRATEHHTFLVRAAVVLWQVVSIQMFLAREGYVDSSLAFFSYGGDVLLAVLTYLLWRAEGKP
jgi:hypothetical protein